ncbi:hypothetical protein L0657_11620 [Dyadobacter sp. CY345]|uniref:hypothetical protein n=1 Tax=Dyadobacter sp. CY345 TaxID=2909335 RepID=UPI001F4695B3|nr:hypothetical protein [Dyadobacter sp. CY345]MCF2444606.1 hypothetical protein [Dyadobacter sp. CY345]
MKNTTIEKAEKSLFSAASFAKDLFSTSAPGGVAGKGVELGMGAILAKTVLKRLPVPLNFLAPIIVEKVILKYGVEEGREVLLKGLRWVKNATEETDDNIRITKENVVL